MTSPTSVADAKRASAKSLADKYERTSLRTRRLDRLVEILPGLPDPLEGGEPLIGRSEWQTLDTRHRNLAIGFLRRSFLRTRHQLHPPLHFAPSAKGERFDKASAKAIKLPKVVFRHKDVPMAAMAPKCTLPVAPLLALVPRLVSTPIEDLPVILNSRLFHFVWQHYHGKPTGKDTPSTEQRLGGFEVPLLTKKQGEGFRAARDKILALAEENAVRLLEMDQVHEIGEAAKVPLVPLHRTEGIIREINVPRPLGEIADVKRRGPVVIFRRGSTIVTTTEEAAVYLELWLQQRFDRLRGMSKEELEDFIRLPRSTAHIVVVLQHRARIELAVDKAQQKIDELQREADEALSDLYGFTPAEREWLRSAVG